MTTNVAVIIPAYNCEEYLAECLDSVLRQPEVAEIILIDDGSTDRTVEISDGYASENPKIKVVHKSNGGVSTARNLGLEIVSSPYFLFVDADDVLPATAVSSMLLTAHRFDSDMVYGNHAIMIGGVVSEPVGELNSFGDGVISASDTLASLANARLDSISGSCYRILYKLSFIRKAGAQFPTGIAISEDYDFILQCLNANPRVSVTHELVYLLRRGSVSVTQRYIPSLEHDQGYVNSHLLSACRGDSALIGLYYSSVANTAWGICSNAYKEGNPYTASERRGLVTRAVKGYSREIFLASKEGIAPAKRILLALGVRAPVLLWAILELRALSLSF